jgi:hypothetical protein
LDGGALYVAFHSSLLVETSNFSSCSSENGNGGAIACSSQSSSIVSFSDLIFSLNAAPNGKGNDFCDVSVEISSVSAYTFQSFLGIVSTSETYRFYHFSSDISFDCFFTDSCKQNIIYIDETEGSDFFICGEILLPCFSFTHSVGVALYPALFYFNTGNYSVNNNVFTSQVVSLLGQTGEAGGNVVGGNLDTYPMLLLNSSTTYSYFLLVSSNSNVTISYLKFFFTSTSAATYGIINGFFLYYFCFFY